MIPFYPSISEIRHSNLTETSRLRVQVDLVTYEYLPGQIKQVVFKYYLNRGNIATIWHEIIIRDLHFHEEHYPHELDLSVILEMETWE